MLIGKWNKSVILTYIGLCSCVLGMVLALKGFINYSFICLIVSGVCDLFDGYVARKCKRSDDEKQFGIELDSLVDAVSFMAFPIVIYISLGFTKWYCILIYFVYAICQVARLGYFNISLNDENKNVPVKFYTGLPVTCSSFIIPLVYLLKLVLKSSVFNIVFIIALLLIAVLNVLKIRIVKPKGKAYLGFSIIAIVIILLYIFIV